jgi:hypothetical protein
MKIEIFYDKSIRFWTAILNDLEGNQICKTALYEHKKSDIDDITFDDFELIGE